jgi:acylphosphatase
MPAVKLTISGRVQGVGYRYWLAEEARRVGLDGWTRNTFAGDVEALFSGDRVLVEAIVERCREGPPAAIVEHIEATAAEPPDWTGFRILADAP